MDSCAARDSLLRSVAHGGWRPATEVPQRTERVSRRAPQHTERVSRRAPQANRGDVKAGTLPRSDAWQRETQNRNCERLSRCQHRRWPTSRTGVPLQDYACGARLLGSGLRASPRAVVEQLVQPCPQWPQHAHLAAALRWDHDWSEVPPRPPGRPDKAGRADKVGVLVRIRTKWVSS